jgi:AbrB family looped-hinge helix DNA binding protein
MAVVFMNCKITAFIWQFDSKVQKFIEDTNCRNPELLIYCISSIQRGTDMRETVIVSNRGQLTLPVSLRRKFGLQQGGPIIIEERGNEIVLKSAVLLEIDLYDEIQITAWDKEDKLSAGERAVLMKKLESKG